MTTYDARNIPKSPDEKPTPVNSKTMMQKQLVCARIMTGVSFATISKETGLDVGTIRTCEGDEFVKVTMDHFAKIRDFYESMGVIFIDRGLRMALVS